MNQTANSGVRENKLSNNIQQSFSLTQPGNPDILFPPQSGNAIPFSQDGLINGWTSIPSYGNSIMAVINGQISFIPIPPGRGVLIADGGNIDIVPAPSGGLSLFNNSLGWTETEECT